MIFRNASGDDLEVWQDGVRTVVAAGGHLEVAGEQAARLAEQEGIWVRSDKPKARTTDTEDK